MSTITSPVGGGPRPPESIDTSDGRDTATVLVFVLAAVALVASVVAVGFGMRAIDRSDSLAAGSGTLAAATASRVKLTELKIEPAVIEAPSGSTLEIENTGSLVHNFRVAGHDLATPMIEAGQSTRLSLVGLAPGDYVVICEVVGHEEGGMTAKLHVTEAAGGSTEAAGDMAGMDHSSAEMSADEMDEVMAKAVKAFPATSVGKTVDSLAPTVLPDGTKRFEVTTEIVKWEVEPGKLVDAWSYNGSVPGPTMRVDPGDKVQVVLHNKLPESTAIHFHGIDLPNAMDGVPDITQPPVKPGQDFTYSFTAQSTSAVGMYHSHHNAAKQVTNGLAGAFLIGTVDVPAGVNVASEQTMMLNDAGTIGFSLNGKSFPATQPVSVNLNDWVLVHYLNEGVTAHPMHLHGLPQLVVAKDGFPVPQPYRADTINVAPGERYSVLVHATVPGVWAWHCHILPHAERSDGMFGMVTVMIVK